MVADGPAGDAPPPRYQLALSYADADKPYVRRVAEALEREGVTLFDRTDPVLAGRNLHREIPRVYRHEVGHAVLFVSAAYVSDADGMSRIERQAALDRALVDDGFLLPARLEDVELPGLSSSIGWFDLAENGTRAAPETVARDVVDWLRTRDGDIRPRSTLTGWEGFDPSKLHCVVVESENGAGGTERLSLVLTTILVGEEGEGVWRSARSCLQGTRTLGAGRDLPADYHPGAVERAVLPVADAVASPAAFDHAVRLIVEADLALFDVTGFEPAVMLLLGVRAATRRGITVVSHGDGWAEGTALGRPFNLNDLSLGSHTPPSTGTEDRRVGRMARRIRNGFDQLARHPQYHDLPVYDALRDLSAESAGSPIPLNREVLVLCPYHPDYERQVWFPLKSEIEAALLTRDVFGTTIARLQDLPTPQIVSQALYEQIRRCVGCVVDWTGGSPSTFLELGVRLVASPWGTVQIASGAWLDGIGERSVAGGRKDVPPGQIRRMWDLFEPIRYGESPGPDLGEAVARTLVGVSESRGTSGHRIRGVAAQAVQQVEARIPDVTTTLQDAADRLDSPDRERYPLPQAVFESDEINLDHEHAARERRLAAWLYLEHRVRAGTLAADDPRRQQWRALGRQVSEHLLASGADADFDLAFEISERVDTE